MLVKTYRLPEATAGGIIIPDSARDAHSGFEYYEHVAAGPAALEHLGLRELHEEAILRVRWQGADGVTGAAPADTGYDDERDGRALLVLLAEQIESVQIWK